MSEIFYRRNYRKRQSSIRNIGQRFLKKVQETQRLQRHKKGQTRTICRSNIQ